jgi:uncharacterized membrane protein YphA (DoxX/SURF4 family)
MEPTPIVAPARGTDENSQYPPWTRAQQYLFRFSFAYALLYFLPTPLGWFPKTEWISRAYHQIWHAIVPWVGEHVLLLSEPATFVRNGSGDTTYYYVLLFCQAAIAVIVAIAWSVWARRAQQHTVLHDRLRIYVRYALATILISYGLVKVFKMQFPFPGPMRLAQAYGDSSPMGLLWTFMGYSTPYSMFSGALEVLGGVLLFWRRTTTLGALITVAVMTNVVLLNFCYDVPVKLFSTHLLLWTIFLLIPDARRLVDVLLLHRPSQPAPPRIPLRWRRVERARPVVKHVVLFIALSAMVHQTYKDWLERGDNAPTHAMYGLYEAETFILDGEERPPLLTDSERWHLVAVGRRATWIRVRTIGGRSELYRLQKDADERRMTFSSPEDGAPPLVFAYEFDGEWLHLTGHLDDRPVEVRLRRRDTSDYLLVTRGFHWINERPFNR